MPLVRGELARRRETGKPTDIPTVTRAMLGHWAGFDLADWAIQHAIYRLADRPPLKPNSRGAAEVSPMEECHKCAGKGRIRGFEHYEGGVCFECGGTGKIEIDTRRPFPVTVETEETRQRNLAANLGRWYAAAASERPGTNRDAWASLQPGYPDPAQTVGWIMGELHDAGVRRDYAERFKRLDLPPEWYDRANAAYRQKRGPKANGAAELFGARGHRVRRGRP